VQSKIRSFEDATTLVRSLVPDLKLVEARRLLAAGPDKAAADAAWTAYDAAIRLANSSLEAVSRQPAFGRLANRGLASLLRWRRVGAAVRDASVTALWQALNVPTADQLQIVRIEIEALRTEIRKQEAAREARRRTPERAARRREAAPAVAA
jgi:hypothetical protein